MTTRTILFILGVISLVLAVVIFIYGAGPRRVYIGGSFVLAGIILMKSGISPKKYHGEEPEETGGQ
jgi:hypothetical protein